MSSFTGIYTASAWRGFTKASERQRIDSVINRARCLGYCSPDTPMFNDLCNNADYELFNKATLWSNHVLHALLPPTSASSQRYNFRQRPHLLQLPEHMTQLSDCSFLIRILYKDTYWLLFFFSCLFYIVMACVMSCLIKRRLIDWLIDQRQCSFSFYCITTQKYRISLHTFHGCLLRYLCIRRWCFNNLEPLT